MKLIKFKLLTNIGMSFIDGCSNTLDLPDFGKAFDWVWLLPPALGFLVIGECGWSCCSRPPPPRLLAAIRLGQGLTWTL